MRLFVHLFVLAALACSNSGTGLAQPSTGPTTLDGLLGSDEARKPTEAGAAGGPKPPAGTVARPKNALQHPDLDRAWEDYEAAVAKATESIRAAITKQFDAATGKGDLDSAEKWQVIGEKLDRAGELPTERDMKAAVSAAVTDYEKAAGKLAKAYEGLVRDLTREKKIADARQIDSEWQRLSRESHKQEGQQPKDSITVLDAKTLASRVLAMNEQEWLRLPGTVFTVSANPAVRCDTGITLQKASRHLFLPCPTDRWNTSPDRWKDTDFRGHDRKDRAANGMPFMRLCYLVGRGTPLFVLETPIVTGIEGPLAFVPSDVSGGGVNGNNTGAVRVKVIPVK